MMIKMTKTDTFQITGMTCNHCVFSITRALRGVPGVQDVQVAIGSAVVQYEPDKASRDLLKETIEEEGYQVIERA